jgi:predicted aspartyl protease
MTTARLASSHFPYLPIHLEVRGHTADLEALLDTGFDGAIVVPPGLVTNGRPPDQRSRWMLADGSEVAAPSYLGTVTLGSFGPYEVLITALGDEPILGRGLATLFRIILDHGREISIEP